MPSRIPTSALSVLTLCLVTGVTPVPALEASPAALTPTSQQETRIPGMAELMAALPPGTVCPRGGCGFGLDGIPEPFAGPGLVAGTPAARDAAAAFPADRATLLGWASSTDMTGKASIANDLWGYTAPSGREYAIIGLREGTAFVEVTDPTRPRPVAVIPGPSSPWRDIKTHGEWAYVVNEHSGGLQVIDLRAIDRRRVRLETSVTDGGLRTAHNLVVNADSGYAYLIGSNLLRGGILAVDLADPARPRLEPVQWNETYVHDLLVVSYARGRHAGREIAFAFTGPRGLHIVDITDKSAPVTVSHLLYDDATYGHSGALSANRRILYLNDELDERYNPRVSRMTTYVIRVGDLASPRLVRKRRWPVQAVDHNSMIQGDRLFLSAYQGGLRVIDISRPRRPRMAGFVDTYPESDGQRFTGAWGVYAGFPSGTVAVSDIQRGLFLVRPD